MQVIKSGSVRVDLVGGTLDFDPINLILDNVVTINVATSLKAHVELQTRSDQKIVITSEDYHKEYSFDLENITRDMNSDSEMNFVLQIISLFDLSEGVNVNLRSGAPAGSGLGGSSAMGVTLYSALCDLTKKTSSHFDTVMRVKGIESRILNQGVAGYQDYFPALEGGVLALKGIPGTIEVNQLYTQELAEFLESHITLVYSGVSRNSGINNWNVYKAFFDREGEVREALQDIATLSFETYQAIKSKEFNKILKLIGEEGNSRKKLSAEIVPEEVERFFHALKSKHLALGLKMCGAGGGGCFILTHNGENQENIDTEIERHGFSKLEFSIEEPLS